MVRVIKKKGHKQWKFERMGSFRMIQSPAFQAEIKIILTFLLSYLVIFLLLLELDCDILFFFFLFPSLL